MILLSSAVLMIDGLEINVHDTIDLEQEIDKHHTLTAVFRMDAIEKDDSKEFGNESKELLGKSIAVQITASNDKNGTKQLEFSGVITKVTIKKGSSGSLGDQIFVIGKSPTIFADAGPHLDSFEDMTLQDIVENTLNFYDIKNDVNPLHTGNIGYSVQQNESGFEYVSRLSKQYGEWFYYNGERVIFGKPELDPVLLTFGQDLNEFEVDLNPLPSQFTYLSNDYINDELLDAKGVESANNSQFRSSVSETSQNLFPNVSQVFANQNNSERANSQLKSVADAQQAAHEINQIKLNAKSTNPGVKLGNVVEVEGNRYRVTKIKHTTNRNQLYKNEFEAVPENPKGYPLTAINAFPKSASQVAIVKENSDPQGLGRVRVQFPWQKKQNKMTPWIRVVALQAGRGGGMYRIPHKGDEVVVDFENGNAEIPYTSGSLYTRNAPPPQGSSETNNYITIWQVGLNLISINEGDGSIEITNKKNSSIKLELNGDITFNASANINILALDGEVNINSPTINIGSEGETPDLTNIHGRNIHIHASQKLELLSDFELSAKGNKTTVEGVIATDIKGAKVSVAGTGLTEIKGAIVKMN